jgi:ring-1,2-phenylacetyl-CoA epoxidase subunit PaaC
MDNEVGSPLYNYLIGLADDELVLGHRDSEWCGLAPILEEDIAFANLALDEIGHASLWYNLAARLSGQDPTTYPDQLIFTRHPEGYRNIQMVELPVGDWAHSILRQYLFDAYELVHRTALMQSSYAPAAEIAAKIRTEEIYHIRHSSAWVQRLGKGTVESRRRMQAALDELWPYTRQLFQPINGEERLVASGYVPVSSQLQAVWADKVVTFLQECTLELPVAPPLQLDREEHTAHLKVMLSEMQSVARLEREARW